MSILCKVCYRKYEATPDRRAKRTWNTLHARIRLQPSYKGIGVRMTRDDFLEWAVPAYTRWMAANPDKTPSLDRIDPAGHYAVDNLRVIERGENSRLARNHPNVHAPEGMAWCHSCEAYLPVDNFWKSARDFNGLQKRCKPCQKSAIKASDERAQSNQRGSRRSR
jgi:hypothetical protein